MYFKKSKIVGQNIKTVDLKKSACLLLVAVLFSTFSLKAQTIPEPPKPPKRATTSSSSSSTSYSTEVNTDDDRHNSSVSISVSDDSYKFKASYHKSKNEGVKSILLDELGSNNLQRKGNTYLWNSDQNGDEIFECKLTKGQLRIYADTEAVSKRFMEKINKLGNDLKYYISGTDRKKEKAKNAENARRELEKVERELARAKSELARAEREAKRAREN